jgi:Zn-dependent protease
MSLVMVVEFVIALAAFFIAVVCHEYAHGRVAYALGDPTARDARRLTLNPLAHIDPFGTVLLPLVLAALRFAFGVPVPIVGYAKPVPINPVYFRHPYQGMMLVALAGPAINLILAGLGTALWYGVGGISPSCSRSFSFTLS